MPCSTFLPEKLTGNQLVRKFPTFYETQMFIIAFTSACHLSLSSIRSIHAYPSHFFKIYFIIVIIIIIVVVVVVVVPSRPRSSKWSFCLRSPNQNPVCTTPVSQSKLACTPPVSQSKPCMHPSCLPINTLYAPLLSPKRATCPAYLILNLTPE